MSRAGLWWVALGVAVAAFVLGNVEAGDQAPSTPPSSTTPTSTTIVAAPRLELLGVDDLRSGRAARFRVGYLNLSGQPVDVVFPTSQDADVALEQGGVVRWRWSDGLAFGQVVRPVRLARDRTEFVLDGRVLDVPPGDYEAVATLVGAPAPPPLRRPVTVR